MNKDMLFIRLCRFNPYVMEAPRLCAFAARRRAERLWCRRICSRYNVDAVRSHVLAFI